MVKKRTSKARTITRVRKNISTSSRRKEKRLTSAQKLILHLNEALAIENAAVQRLQSRIKQTKIENVKQRLQTHLEETKRQQDRLKQLISDLGNGQKNAHTKDKAQLPIPSPPKSLTDIFRRMMTSAEYELKAAKEDAIVENAEIILYDMLTHLAERMNAAMQYLFCHKAYQKKELWLIGLKQIRLIWLHSFGLKLMHLLLL